LYGDDAAWPRLTVSTKIDEGEQTEMFKGLIGKKIGMTQIFDETVRHYPLR